MKLAACLTLALAIVVGALAVADYSQNTSTARKLEATYKQQETAQAQALAAHIQDKINRERRIKRGAAR